MVCWIFRLVSPADYESGALPTELIQHILFSGHLNRGGLTVTNQALYRLS